MTESGDGYPGRTPHVDWCDGCENRIRSQIHRTPVDGTHQFCHGCLTRIRADDLEPGEDFEMGGLWTPEAEGVTADAE